MKPISAELWFLTLKVILLIIVTPSTRLFSGQCTNGVKCSAETVNPTNLHLQKHLTIISSQTRQVSTQIQIAN